MNYFAAIAYRASELDALGEAYLSGLPFLPDDEVVERIVNAAYRLFEESGEDRDAIPKWAASCVDGWIPGQPPSNGSLYYALGWSIVSQSAHVRNLLERAEGRETKELPFPILAEHEVVNRLADEGETS